MKSILILYMPGHAGNFLTRLFSLSPETIPHLSFNDLLDSTNTGNVPTNRLESYFFTNVKSTYTNWQQFHRNFVDLNFDDKIELLNKNIDNQYSKVIYAIHPAEFFKLFEKIVQKNIDLYHVELDLSIFGTWVENAQRELKFIVRPGEETQFKNIVSVRDSKPINLTKMLTSELDFVDEYHRVCKLMNLTPVEDQAVQLYQDWCSVRLHHDAASTQHSPIKIFSRATHDQYTFTLFNKLLKKIQYDFEAHYVWTNPTENFYSFMYETKFSKPNIVIGIKDLLDSTNKFNFWTNPTEPGIELIKRMLTKHQDKNFIIFTSVENVGNQLTAHTNVTVIPWGGDMTNQASQYPLIDPVLDKNFNSTKTFISLNRNYRQHRIILLSYLASQGCLSHGQVSCLAQLPEDLLSVMPWQFDMERHSEIREKILSGYKNGVYNNDSLLLDSYDEIYTHIGNLTDNDNFTNFNERLRSKYKNSFVELVTESSFESPCFMITEKFLNSVYGCNFPILFSGAGAVAHLREVGFDMFDDIVDHSHDTISNPFDRIVTAVDCNKRLLTDSEYAKQMWRDNQHRFEKNINFARKGMYDWFSDRATAQFNNIQWR